MQLLLGVLVVLLVAKGVEPRRGGGGVKERGAGRARGRVRGVGRAGAVKRYASDCKEYVEAGEKFLDCQDKQLTSVLDEWPDDIDHLLLARNKIQVLRDHTFSRFRQLKSLDLQQNDLSLMEDGAFAGLGQLTTLLLQHNHLRQASEELLLPLPRLRYLRLYDNPWDCSCPLDSLVRLLQVPSNRNLGNFARCAEPPDLRGEKLKTLKVEQLCAEGIQERPGGAGGGSDPRPPHKPPHKPPHETATSMCHTYMHPKPLLDCSSKDLKSVPANLPSDIVKMDLSRNLIGQLRARDFLAAKDLKLLNLSGNSLNRIDTAAFSGLLYLRELDLSNNSLSHFQYGVLEDLYFLRKLSLDGNPWVCDYNIHYLTYWLKHHPGVAHTGLVCAQPQEFRGWAVEDYVKTYNGECPKDKQLGGRGGGGGGGGQDQDQGGGGGGVEAQEVKGETEEEESYLLPRPIIDNRPKKVEIFRLS